MKVITKLAVLLSSISIFHVFASNAEELVPDNEKVTTHKEVSINETTATFDDSDFKEYEVSEDETHNIDDPLEPLNRTIFSFNKGVDALILNPVSHTYRAVTPIWGRDRIDNALSNLREPVNFGNSILQGDPDKAGRAMGRFLVNTLLGLGGLIDVATEAGIPAVNEDFGKTLAHYGVDTGPYLVLPIIGPSSIRDFPSLAVDMAMDPYTWSFHQDASSIRSGVKLINTKESFLNVAEDIEQTSLDEYTTYRSIYAQKRKLITKQGN